MERSASSFNPSPSESADEETLRQEEGDLARSRALSRTGTTMPGRAPGYDIVRCLGEGSFGSVWLAHEARTGRQVAIKFYTHSKGLDWSLLSREVEKLAVLYTSRNIVGLLDVGWDHDPPYYVMEYLEQGPLSSQLADGALSPAESVRIAREVLSALVHAHNSGILHCDLKPANILVDSGGTPRLGDFGQSRLSTEQSPALGTLYYMAPEQASLEATPDARWDVYALGVLLYQMLTGQLPYRTPENEQKLKAAKSLEERLAIYRRMIASSPMPDAHRGVKGVDPRLTAIVDGCLERDPQKRLPNAQVILDLLQQRDQAIAKRPLMVLGIAGPLLLLATVLTIASRAIPVTVHKAEDNLVERAMKTDAVAAKILAGSVQQEFDIRLKELEDVADELVVPQADGGSVLRPDYEEFLDAWASRAGERLAKQNRTGDESVFMSDANGTQIYRQPRDRSIGKNYARRDYFHGQGREFPVGTMASARTTPGISLAYRSSSSRQYKVAVATPVWNTDRTKVLGVLARSINLTDLLDQWESRIATHPSDAEIPDGVHRSHERFLALVDARETPPHLLDHPWMSDQKDEQLEDAKFKAQLELPEEQAKIVRTRETYSRYDDPIAKIDPQYIGPWLAAFAPVGTTGWIAIVQEKRSAAVAPVNSLREVFIQYGIGAFVGFAAAFALLWMLIRRAAR
jgi:serine/threonine protein kinase